MTGMQDILLIKYGRGRECGREQGEGVRVGRTEDSTLWFPVDYSQESSEVLV